ncbi:hypothetical protein HBH56_161340 [Parastagonospora nodorum]|uniref:Uncharacterized protein n=1 Tax=Phaeosphaeria nodorum (strain SN15 / ATCC MYA-4574 / FGSC 10173) TaxID=321614 RepID=A0A7U2NQ41_PHANO|nr:hypothetical protein HBH56_161340 [Parastagonospora nodorum]QRD06329.1 hypothetical protein JI435_117170 [Parastagonospora nodorum SN15]KAH3931702.1 hypothetical protein HBH54_087900 [Parastagonospora nodorum]KAH3972649.1 hypothetical protein HBH51_102560 [Parastagonospora nodorum]KAH4064243.1 hypothetical protein HBH50_176620 [Parastagonospora nodorum]
MQYQDHNSAGGIDQQGTPANFGWDCCIYGDQYACMKIHGPEQAILEGEEAVWEVEQVEQEDTSDDDEDDSSDEDDTSDEDDASDEVEETEDGVCLDNDDYLVEQDYMTQDVYLNHDDHFDIITRGDFTHGQDTQHENYEQTAAHATSFDAITRGVITHSNDTQFEGYEQTAVHATSSRSFFQFHNTAKTSSRFRTLTGKAKEHLRDENNRKKAVETFQNGMREVTAFVTEIQAKQGAAGSKRAGPKGDGKELAMICGKVAMKRFKK